MLWCFGCICFVVATLFVMVAQVKVEIVIRVP